jgi:glycosyltransferase involved in cell wall biosynthesis
MTTIHAKGHRIVAIIPAYNEARFIGSVVLRTKAYANPIIVVDDGSTDGTGKLAAEAGALVITHTTNQGKGCALNTGLCKARAFDPDAVVVLDADGQHHPKDISRLLEPIPRGDADIVVGSRYLAGNNQVPRHRRLGHRAFNALTNVASGVRATDSQSGFRAFSRRALDLIIFSSKSFSVESEMQFLARDLGLVYKEVAITVSYRDKPKRSVVLHGLIVLQGLLDITRRHRPLLFFGFVGLLMLVTGLIAGFWVVECFTRTGGLATGPAVICALFCMLGLRIISTAVVTNAVQGLLLDYLSIRRDDHATTVSEP